LATNLFYAVWSAPCAISIGYFLKSFDVRERGLRIISVTCYVLSPYLIFSWASALPTDLGGFVLLPAMLGAYRRFTTDSDMPKFVVLSSVAALSALVFGASLYAIAAVTALYLPFVLWLCWKTLSFQRQLLPGLIVLAIVVGIDAATIVPSLFSLSLPQPAPAETLPTNDLLIRLFGHPDALNQRSADAATWNASLAQVSAAMVLLQFVIAFLAIRLKPSMETKFFTAAFVVVLVVQLVVMTPMAITIPLTTCYVFLFAASASFFLQKSRQALPVILGCVGVVLLGAIALAFAIPHTKAEGVARSASRVATASIFTAPSFAVGDIDPLLLIPAYVLDFLCIHPFRDGNGRIARRSTLLLLYHAGYEVGRYISLERFIEESKESYYETLYHASQHWHEGKHELRPWTEYFLGVLVAAHREFEDRVGAFKAPRGVKTEMVLNAVRGLPNRFRMRDVEGLCPSVTREMIRVVLNRLKKEGSLTCERTGPGAEWQKCGNIPQL